MQRFVSWRAPWMEEDRAHADWQTGREIGVMLIGSTVVRGFSALAEENALGEVATSGNRAWPAGNGWHGA